MKRLAVLGHPIAHSRSPAMHNAAFAELGLGSEWGYEAIDVPPEAFAEQVDEMIAEGFVGANVTIPHKRAALLLADDPSDAARAIGAANTLSFGPAGIRAENTDAPGLLAAIEDDPSGRRALVLGAGGAGRAAAWALNDRGAEVTIWNRTASRAAELAAELGCAALPEGAEPDPEECDLLVNSTSVGLHAGAQASSPQIATFKEFGFAADQIADRQVVVDLAYGSTETELVRAARSRGARTIDGLEILVRQGAASFEIWTGLEAPLATMRRAVQPQHQ
ncbi:MAG TPA: shikimate dehydrogenase [Solirubrobacterales bacterium]|nr:shikimate dehydrogenase [Solirubrobacterales bacterium]